ncbi:MAG: type IV toxin-antitoxin system AbiEi family antitoxin domain-containing protein [Rhodospirillales bacterium]|nr:type IV toxin-antitoxin system AbiEi family antitoxin domain-containing protein [Rhodospirillales bacterium]
MNSGLSVSQRQQRLSALLRAVKGPVRVEDAAHALGLERTHAAKLLAAWHKQGVMRRVARGLYIPVSPTALGQTQVLDDPWVLVPELYEPGYIGGWSALEYWELTEQLFRSVCVLTSKRTQLGNVDHQGITFFLKHVPDRHLFGTKTLWRENVKVQISDIHKTILDIVDDPYLGAGLQHTVDCLRTYKGRHSDPASLERLFAYAAQTGLGSVFKKLGFLAELLAFDPDFVERCAARLTNGYAHLDKRAKNEKLVTKWRLWVPKGFDV